jgi:hypothetical protein
MIVFLKNYVNTSRIKTGKLTEIFANNDTSGLSLRSHDMFCNESSYVDARYEEQRFQKWNLRFHGIDPKKKPDSNANMETMNGQEIDIEFEDHFKRTASSKFLELSHRWPTQLKNYYLFQSFMCGSMLDDVVVLNIKKCWVLSLQIPHARANDFPTCKIH